jgi:hypothetical protein
LPQHINRRRSKHLANAKYLLRGRIARNRTSCRKPGLRANSRSSKWSSADTVLAAEFVYPPACIDDLLFTGVKGMACRADFDEEVLTKRGAGRKFVAAATGDFDIAVGGMNLGFHLLVLELRLEKGA